MKSRVKVLLWTVFAMAAFSTMALAGSATVTSVEGDVTVQTKADGAWTKATAKMTIPEGATIKSGADGKASLSWSGNVAKIYPFSQVKASSLQGGGNKASLLSLDKGRVMSKVEKLKGGEKFEVRTPTAIAGVRGTGFDTAIDPTSSVVTVAVVEGEVSLTIGDMEVMIQSGFELSAMPGEAPATPEAIPVEKLDDLKQDLVQISAEVETAATSDEKAEADEKGEADESSDSEEASADVMSDVTDNVVEDVTINNEISDTAADLAECPIGGGCISGTISFGSGSN